MLDSITIARCADRHRVSAKRLLPDRDPALKSSWRSTDDVFEVDLETHPLTGLGSILNLLRQLQPDRHAFIMRGAPTAEALARGCRRVRRITKAKHNKRTGVVNPPYVETRARFWACIDVDDLEAPEGMDPTGPEALAYVVDHLPPEFHGVSFVYQWSNRAGFCGRKIKVHIWVWLTEPRTDEELRRWARTTKLVDFQLYKAVQPHYVADPILPEGVTAPLVGPRTGMILGERDAVELRMPDGAAGRVRLPVGAPAPAVDTDDAGKVFDGREELQRAIRLEVILDENCPDEEDAFHAEVWRRLNERAVTRATAANPKEWTFGEVRSKGEADWDNREELRKRFGKRTRKPVPGGEPEFPAPCPVPLAEGQDTARKLFADYFSRPRDLVIRGGVGLGKTELAAEALAAVLAAEALAAVPAGVKVAYFAPAHVNLNDVKERIGKRNPAVEVVVVQTRNEETCSKWEQVEPIAEKGGLVAPVLCGRKPPEGEPGDEPAPACKSSCANRLTCGFWRQFEVPAQVYLFATEQLRFEPQEGLPKFDFTIVDEAFWQTFVQHVDVELTELLALRDGYGDEVERALRRAIWEALTDRKDCPQGSAELLTAVREAWAACVDRALAEEPEETAPCAPCGPASGVAAVLERGRAWRSGPRPGRPRVRRAAGGCSAPCRRGRRARRPWPGCRTSWG